jgi:hypothetical protein
LRARTGVCLERQRSREVIQRFLENVQIIFEVELTLYVELRECVKNFCLALGDLPRFSEVDRHRGAIRSRAELRHLSIVIRDAKCDLALVTVGPNVTKFARFSAAPSVDLPHRRITLPLDLCHPASDNIDIERSVVPDSLFFPFQKHRVVTGR